MQLELGWQQCTWEKDEMEKKQWTGCTDQGRRECSWVSVLQWLHEGAIHWTEITNLFLDVSFETE